MTTCYQQPGDILTYTAPSGGVTAGTPVLIGASLVIPEATVAQTLPFQGRIAGVFNTMPKATSQSWTAGALLYWDNSAFKFTTTNTANTRVGTAAADAQSADTTGVVRLDGIAVGGAAP
jgi:predicted RecA/RadA family phage recombinase